MKVAILGLFGVLCMGSAVADATWSGLDIQDSCAPYDGAAFVLHANHKDGRKLHISVNTRLQPHMSGEWKFSYGAKSDSASATICSGSEKKLDCVYGERGDISIFPIDPTHWRVRFDGSFQKGKNFTSYSGDFQVAYKKVSTPMMCG